MATYLANMPKSTLTTALCARVQRCVHAEQAMSPDDQLRSADTCLPPIAGAIPPHTIEDGSFANPASSPVGAAPPPPPPQSLVRTTISKIADGSFANPASSPVGAASPPPPPQSLVKTTISKIADGSFANPASSPVGAVLPSPTATPPQSLVKTAISKIADGSFANPASSAVGAASPPPPPQSLVKTAISKIADGSFAVVAGVSAATPLVSSTPPNVAGELTESALTSPASCKALYSLSLDTFC